MSDNKNIVDSIQQSLTELRTKTEEGIKDVVRKNELEALTTEVENKIKGLQDALAAQNTVSAADVAADAEQREKSAVYELFTKGDRAISHIDGDKAFIKADGDTAALTVAAQGGYLLPKVFNDMADGIIRKTSALRSVAKVVKGNLGFVTPIKTVKGTAGLRGEFDPLHYSTAPKYDLLSHQFQEINSTEAETVWADANTNAIGGDFTQTIIQDVSEALAEQESDYFMNGVTPNSRSTGGTFKNGLLQQTKLVTGVDRFTNTFGSLAGVETTDDVAVGPDDLIALYFSLHGRYTNVQIMTSRDVLRTVITKKDDQGRYLLDVGGAQDGWAARIMGVPLVVSDFMPSVADAGDKPVAIIGDFRQAVTIVDASPMRWLVDPYTDKRLIQYTGRYMTSSAVTNYNALRALYVKA